MNTSLACLFLAATAPALPPIIFPPDPSEYITVLEAWSKSLEAALDDCRSTAEVTEPTTTRRFRAYDSMRALLARMPKQHTGPTRFDPVNFDAVNGWLADMRGQVFEATLTCVAADGYSAQFEGSAERIGKMNFKLRIVASLRQPGQKRAQTVKLGQTYHINGIIGGTNYDPMTGYNPMTYAVGLINCEIRPARKRG